MKLDLPRFRLGGRLIRVFVVALALGSPLAPGGAALAAPPKPTPTPAPTAQPLPLPISAPVFAPPSSSGGAARSAASPAKPSPAPTQGRSPTSAAPELFERPAPAPAPSSPSVGSPPTAVGPSAATTSQRPASAAPATAGAANVVTPFSPPSPTASTTQALFVAPTPEPAPGPETPAPGASATVARPDDRSAVSGADILAGRGLHWGAVDGTAADTDRAARRSAGVDAVAGEAARRVVTSFAALRPGGDRAGPSEPAAWADATSLWLGVPFRTQIDGSEFSLVNCGPASLSMVLATFGIEVGPPSIRDFVNYLSGDYSADDGTSLHILARVAREAGLNTFGVANTWTVDAVRQHVLAGHPVITLVKYRSLPGHGTSLAEFDHYIVIAGVAGEDFIYNDSAFASDYGDSLLISPRELERGWSYSSVPRHAVAVGLGASLRPLAATARTLSAASLAMPPPRVVDPAAPSIEPDLADELRPDELRAEQAMTETPLAMVPGPAAQWIHERMLAEVGVRAGARERAVDPTPLFQPSATMLEAFRDSGDATGLEARSAARSEGGAAAVHPPVVEAAMATLPMLPVDSERVDAAGYPTPRTPGAVYLVLLLVCGLIVRRHGVGRSQRP